MARGISLASCAAAVIVTAAAAGAAAADEDGTTAGGERAFSVELRAGVEYDSNVAVLELDSSSGRGDVAGQLELGLGYNKSVTDRLRLNAGYNLSQSLHNDFDEFDLRIQRASGGLSYNFGGVTFGTTGNYVSAELDGDEFLVLRQLSPSLAKLFGRRVFLRLAHTYAHKDFHSNPERDATASSVSADTFIFLNGLTTYLVVGLRHDREDAAAEHFDYTGERVRVQLTRRVSVGSRRLTLRGQARFENRDYRAPTPALGERRKDERLQLEAVVELPLTERVDARFGYKRSDNRSNLPSVDFGENVWSASFRMRL